MDAVEFLKTWKRMCKQSGGKCALGCPLLDLKRESNKAICREAVMDGPEKAVVIVQKWAEEHPVKTMMSDFFEKFPNAKSFEDGTPTFCPSKLGHSDMERDCLAPDDCLECWSRPLEEE